MSQAGRYTPSVVPGTYVESLTGNSGGAVYSAGGNIFVVGDGVLATVTGDPGTNTLEITLSASIPIDFQTDSGTAIPTLNTLIITGATTGLIFDASGNTVGLAGTLDVLNGGTGNNAVVAYAPICGGTTTTGSFQSANTGISNSGYVFVSNGSSALPSFQEFSSLPFAYTGINHASSPYTVLSTDYYISADVTGGVITVKLPNAPSTGRTFVIKDKVGLSATSNITITTVGGTVTIDGSTSFVMNSAYEAVSVLFDGSNYEVF